MKIRTRRTVTAVAAGALAVGGLAVAAPAVAGAGPFGPGPSAATAADPPAFGMGPGSCMGRQSTTARQGTLIAAQKTTLAAMAQEEKLAHDLYMAFADRYDAVVFDHIAGAESRHLTAVRTLLQRYGVSDPTAIQPPATFTDPAVQATYDKLLAAGRASLPAALDAAQQVERADIADLRAALDGLTAPDVQQVYRNLLTASQRHLTAFTHWSGR